MIINKSVGARGYYSEIKVINKNGKVKKYEGFNNLLTNTFFTQLQQNAYCQVGTGTNPPTQTDNSLQSPVGPRDLTTAGDIIATDLGSNIYEIDSEFVYSFALGSVVGNISEIGIFNSSSGNNCYSRALILDALGDPIVIPVTVDEQLVITWHLVYNYDTTPITYNSVDVDGTPTDITIRFNNLSRPSIWFSSDSNPQTITNFIKPQITRASLGTVSQIPGMETPGSDLVGVMTNGGQTSNATKSFVAIDNDSTTSVLNITASTVEMNTSESNFIYSVGQNSSNANSINYSLEFDPAIEKTNLQTLSIRLVTTFTRA